MRHGIISRLLAVGTVAGLALTGVAGANANSGGKPKAQPAQVGGAKLELVVNTTSDWTQIRVGGSGVLASKLSGVGGAGTWTLVPNGISLSSGNANHHGGATDTMVVENLNPDKDISVELKKGFDGTTTLRIYSLNGGGTRKVATLTDSRHSYSDDTNHQVFQVASSALFQGAPLAYKRADNRHLVLAFYYPWFTTYQDRKLADHPSDPRNCKVLADVESMTKQAKDNGISGFIVSWDGTGKTGHQSQFDLALQAAQDNKQVITGYVESVEAKKTKHPVQSEQNWIRELLAHDKSSAFLKTGGVPDIFVYQMGEFTPAQWTSIIKTLRTKDGDRFHLIGDETDASYLPLEWGVHQYAATDGYDKLLRNDVGMGLIAKAPAILGTGPAKLYAATVSPGFDDQKLRGKKHPVVARDGGKRYLTTWVAALASRPDWVLVTSWNEWYEDTQVEPGTKTGSGALTLTHDEAHGWRTDS